MKYRWLESVPSINELELELGCKIKDIVVGWLITGYDGKDEFGQLMPTRHRGIDIEFEQEPTAEQINKLDDIFSLQKLKREGGKDLVAEIDALKVRIEKLERLGRK